MSKVYEQEIVRPNWWIVFSILLIFLYAFLFITAKEIIWKYFTLLVLLGLLICVYDCIKEFGFIKIKTKTIKLKEKKDK